jgi:hypothetical protein
MVEVVVVVVVVAAVVLRSCNANSVLVEFQCSNVRMSSGVST